MAMTVSPVSVSAAFDPQAAAARRPASAASTSAQSLSVAFQPPSGASAAASVGDRAQSAAPLGSLGADLAQRLEAFDKTRLESRKAAEIASRDLSPGPASGGGANAAYEKARAELAAGPASLRVGAAQTPSPGAAAANSGLYDRAFDAMRQSFDYAIETQMVVKTGSQFASSLNQLMRGQ